jgi:uncharacterized protein (DUF1778 family)
MRNARRRGKREHQDTPVTPGRKGFVQPAAGRSRQSLADSPAGSTQAAAKPEVHTHQVIELTARETEILLAALENPPAPNEQLRAAARKYASFLIPAGMTPGWPQDQPQSARGAT